MKIKLRITNHENVQNLLEDHILIGIRTIHLDEHGNNIYFTKRDGSTRKFPCANVIQFEAKNI